jgi:alcohol dehydrogenase (NADP+)
VAPTDTPKTTVGVVGCGAVSEEYLAGIEAAPDLQLVAVADRDRGRARQAADARDGSRSARPQVFGDAETMVADAEPTLVVNLTSHAAHAPVSRACLAAGAHVYSEKPLAMDAATARELLDLAARENRRVGCAPVSHVAPTTRRLRRLLVDDRLGSVRMGYATANVGRVTEWHDDPESFLRAGPLRDGGVYPLTVLVSLFGPVSRVRTADTAQLLSTHTVDGTEIDPDVPDHALGVLEFDGGLRVQLTASGYVPYRSREFVSLELHGDEGSIYAADCGGFDRGDRTRVQFGRLGREYGPVPVQTDDGGVGPADGPAELAAAVREERTSPVDANLAAHVVAVIDAIERAAETGDSVDVAPFDLSAPDSPGRRVTDGRTDSEGVTTAPWPVATDPVGTAASEAITLPPVGFGCSRYRGGDEYVDLAEPIEWALDAGYRLFDAAELYGVEGTLGDALDRPGSPDRGQVWLTSKVWNTNHEPDRLRAACEASLDRLGVERLDCYMLHWPTAWEHQGPLTDVAELSHEAIESLAFPTDGTGSPLEADVSLETTWAAMDALVRDGLADTIGICNVDRETLEVLLATAETPPAVVQVERHPYDPRESLVDWCHDRDVRVQAHSPLSAPGLLDEPAVTAIADAHGVTPARVVLRWNVERGVVPLPSSTDREHVLDNLDVFGFTLTDRDRDRLGGLRDPDFSRP